MQYATDTADVTCAILAGGKSSRFGSNKALACWNHGKTTVLEAVIKAAGQVSPHCMIIADNAGDYTGSGLPVYPDIIPGRGPLSGIHAAMHNSRTERVLILGCDMPMVSVPFLTWLIRIRTYAPVVVPESESGIEPLHAVWHRSLEFMMKNYLLQGKTGLRHIIHDLPSRIISTEEIRRQGHDPRSIASANTPEELERLGETGAKND